MTLLRCSITLSIVSVFSTTYYAFYHWQVPDQVLRKVQHNSLLDYSDPQQSLVMTNPNNIQAGCDLPLYDLGLCLDRGSNYISGARYQYQYSGVVTSQQFLVMLQR